LAALVIRHQVGRLDQVDRGLGVVEQGAKDGRGRRVLLHDRLQPAPRAGVDGQHPDQGVGRQLDQGPHRVLGGDEVQRHHLGPLGSQLAGLGQVEVGGE
jgi:hypothetical protein